MMKNKVKLAIRLATLVLATSTMAACATVTRGTKTTFEVRTSPAGASVQTSTGYSCTSPCKMKMPRKDAFQAKVSKPGYKTVNATVLNRISTGGGTGMAGNILIGGGIGLGVDALTGAGLDLRPNPLILVLEPGEGVISLSGPDAEAASRNNEKAVPKK